MITQQRARKVMLIGVDAATGNLFQKFGEQGKLPNIMQLIKKGVLTKSFPAFPPSTSVNWTTIATGAYPGTHGVTGMYIHKKGDPLEKRALISGFYSTCCKAERLWETAERANKIPMLLKYTTSWPPSIEKGIQVGGFGNPWWSAFDILPRMCFATYELPHSVRTYLDVGNELGNKGLISHKIKVQTMTKEWKNLPNSLEKPLETILKFSFPDEDIEKSYFVLILKRASKYDQIAISERRDWNAVIAKLSVGQWSNSIVSDFVTKKGGKRGTFRCRLVELSNNGENLKIYVTRVLSFKNWTFPKELADDLIRNVGPYQDLSSIEAAYYAGWIGLDAVLDEFEYQIKWLGKAAEYLMSSYAWDIFFTQWHGVDHISHMFLGGMDRRSIFYDHKREKMSEEAILKVYTMADEYVGKLMRLAGKDTLIVVTSDHGIVPIRADFYMQDLLDKMGFTKYKKDPKTGVLVIDWSKTKAYELTGGNIFINLKERDPQGIVEPGTRYEALRDELLKVLRDAKYETGDHVVAMAFKKEDAEFLGLSGDSVGDIVYFKQPGYSTPMKKKPPKWLTGQHHGYLTSATFDIGEMKAVTIFSGPGVKKGFRRDKAINLVDIAPTISHLLNIPPPRNAEGRVLWDILD